MEAARRRTVAKGIWSEEESHRRIREEVAREAARQQENEREYE